MNPKKKNIKRRKKELHHINPPDVKAILSPPNDKAIHGPSDSQSNVKDKMIRPKRNK